MNLSKKELDIINKSIVQNLLSANRIDDIKKIAISCGKSDTTTLNLESLKALENTLGAEEYNIFYANLKP